jgi:hypothetical protein
MERPAEVVDRLRGRIENAVFRPASGRVRLSTEPRWHERLHEALGVAWPCSAVQRFDAIWAEVGHQIQAAGLGHDADVALAQGVFCLTHHLRPRQVVETGVARGVTSRMILEGLDSAKARLWSIDLPLVKSEGHDQVAGAVPQRLRARWTYIRGSSRSRLVPLLRRLGQIDLFVQDSLHTRPTVLFECRAAWRALRPGGVLLVDDADLSDGFLRFVREIRPNVAVAAPHERKRGAFGIVIKEASAR